MSEERIYYHHPDAAEHKTVELTGWWSRTGQFYGNDEDLARWAGCTHKKCECGLYMEKTWTKCEKCREKADRERWEALPHVEWDGNTPVYCNHLGEYFFDDSSLIDAIEDRGIQVEELQLTICVPNIPRIIDDDHWHDDLPEDQYLDDVCPELAELVHAVNDYIDKNKPIFSWFPGKTRTSINPQDYKTQEAA